MSPSTPSPAHAPLRAALARGLWLALLLLAARSAVVFGLDHLVQGRPLELARSRLAEALPGIAWRALGVGFLAALLAAPRAPARRAANRSGPRLPVARLLLPVLAGLAVAAYGAGWLQSDPSRALGTDTPRGRAALAGVALASAALVVLVARLGRRATDRRPGGWTLLSPALLFLGLALLGPRLVRPADDAMELREVVLELLAGDPGWTGSAAHVDTLTPSLDYRLRGADMVSLVLPPPGEVRVPPLELDGPAHLLARVGLDRSVLSEPGLEGARVRFELDLDGRTAFAHEIPVVGVGEHGESEWVDVGGAGGLAVGPGTTLTLRTALLDAAGAPLEPPAPLAVGFGGLVCERRWTAPRAAAGAGAPNLVVVVMDTERVDRLSAYGYARPTSPNLERLAARGTLFEEAYATGSWTWPSTASLLTGLLPAQHGVESDASCTLAHALLTLPEVLQRAGYSTAAWSANPLIVPDRNFDQGFEYFERGGNSPRATDTFFPLVREWLRLHAEHRFFLYLQLMDVHTPRRPHPEALARLASDVPAELDALDFVDVERALLRNAGHTPGGELALDAAVPAAEQAWHSEVYDAAVASGDRWLGLLLEELAALGLEEDTVVVFTSDHGEELFDHGLAGHGQSLFPELTRVPLVLAGPGVPAGRRVAGPVSNRHLAPTLARLAGAGPLEVADAHDLLRDPPGAAPAALLLSTTLGWWNGVPEQPIHALREGPWELHWAPRGADWGAAPAPGGQWRLYQVAQDPERRRDRAAEVPDVAERLRAALGRRLAELEALRTAAPRAAGAATRDMLRAMGYVDD